MFKDKQSLGVCGVEAEVLLYAQSPCETLDTYICISLTVGVQITHIVLICWFAVEVGSEGIKKPQVMDLIKITSYTWTLNRETSRRIFTDTNLCWIQHFCFSLVFIVLFTLPTGTIFHEGSNCATKVACQALQIDSLVAITRYQRKKNGITLETLRCKKKINHRVWWRRKEELR